MEFPLGYREVIPDQTVPEKWKEITLNTGLFNLTFKIEFLFISCRKIIIWEGGGVNE